jgi:ABC-type multidrug transport system ATPase subunit
MILLEEAVKHRKGLEVRVKCLALEGGRRVFVIGPSGSGKSTLLGMICGILPPEEGRVEIDGHDVAALARRSQLHRLNVMLLDQELGLWPHLSVREHLEFVTGSRGEERWIGLLETLGLHRHLGHRPSELSGGERQRLALARTLAAAPRHLLLDEPFASLDPVLAAELHRLLEEMQRERGFTLVEVTHRLHPFRENDDRILVMERGRIVRDTTLRGLLDEPQSSWEEKWVRLWHTGSLG